jgi:hypothetical protein
MTQIEMAALELLMKEQRVSFWETHHRMPGCNDMADCFDNMPATI